MTGLNAFTLVHVLLSLAGIFSGFIVVGGMMAGKRLDGWTIAFLITNICTNVSGFGFPFERFLPSHAVAIISLVVLAVVLVARYLKRMAGAWLRVYVIGAVAALYFNAFVLNAQLFLRLPALTALAPTQKEPPFAVTQLLTLALFVWLGRACVRGFRADSIVTRAATA